MREARGTGDPLVDGQHAARLESEIRRGRGRSVASEGGSEDDQHNRDGNLADDEQAAQPRRAEGRRGLAAQRVSERQARRLEGGQQSEEQRGSTGDGEGEHEHPDVEVERYDAHQHTERRRQRGQEDGQADAQHQGGEPEGGETGQ